MKNFLITCLAVVIALMPLLIGVGGVVIVIRETGWIFFLGLFLILFANNIGVSEMVEKNIVKKVNKGIENAQKEKGGN